MVCRIRVELQGSRSGSIEMAANHQEKSPQLAKFDLENVDVFKRSRSSDFCEMWRFDLLRVRKMAASKFRTNHQAKSPDLGKLDPVKTVLEVRAFGNCGVSISFASEKWRLRRFWTNHQKSPDLAKFELENVVFKRSRSSRFWKM